MIDNKKKIINELFCPFCGQKMIPDLHGEAESKIYNQPYKPRWYDNWMCNSSEDNDLTCKVTGQTVLIDRDDLKRLLEIFDIEGFK